MEVIPALSYFEGIFTAPFGQSGFLCDVLELVQTDLFCADRTVAVWTSGGVGAWQIPVSWKKGYFISVYDPDDPSVSGDDGIRIYRIVLFFCAGYALGSDPSGGLCHLSGISDDKIFSADTGFASGGGESRRGRGGGIFFLYRPATWNAGNCICFDLEFSRILECNRGADDISKDKEFASGLSVFIKYHGQRYGERICGIHSDHGAFDIFICLWAELFRAGDSCIRIKGVEA